MMEGAARMTLCLSHEELREITGKTRYTTQAKALEKMGIRYTRRPNGSPMVLRENLTHAPEEKRQTPPTLRFSEARGVLVRKGRKVETACG
jgi:hypothetical protein